MKQLNHVDSQYHDLLFDIMTRGVKKQDRTGVGTYSKFGHMMRFDLRKGFPLVTTKRIYTKAMFHEQLWFLKGGDNIKYLVDNGVRIWNEWPHAAYNKEAALAGGIPLSMPDFVEKIKTDDEFAKKWGDLGPVYGKQWVEWQGHFETFNQIDTVIDQLKNGPDSRRIMVTAWNPAELQDMLLPPCHYAFQLWTRELTAEQRWALDDEFRGVDAYIKKKYGNFPEYYTLKKAADVQEDKSINKIAHEAADELGLPSRGISMMFHMRSVDCFLGMPFDIASYATLLHMFGHVCNMVPEELVITTGDTHIYQNHLEQVKTQLERESFPLPKFRINKTEENANDIYKIKYEDLVVEDYQYHPSIKAPVAV